MMQENRGKRDNSSKGNIILHKQAQGKRNIKGQIKKITAFRIRKKKQFTNITQLRHNSLELGKLQMNYNREWRKTTAHQKEIQNFIYNIMATLLGDPKGRLEHHTWT